MLSTSRCPNERKSGSESRTAPLPSIEHNVQSYGITFWTQLANSFGSQIGRGGFQQRDFGPPATVQGTFPSQALRRSFKI